MSKIIPPANWQPFDLKTNNLERGIYWWRMKSKSLPEMTIMFLAELRPHGGLSGGLSPSFDSWDGYRVIVPECEWAHAEEIPSGFEEYREIHIEGLNPLKCPFCGEIPKIRGSFFYNDGGILCGAKPHQFNSWMFSCCHWSSNVWRTNPYIIEKERREAFKRVKEMDI